ncbi:MAG: ABC transporter permease [Candidatus Bathyarchaeia archaeon]
MERRKLIQLLSENGASIPVRPLSKVWAFVVRDFKNWWTYKLWVTLDVTGTVVFIATYYLVSTIVSSQQVAEAGYTLGGYFSFAMIGIAFQQYVFFAVQGISESIREEQWHGTMESILASATSFRLFLFGESAFRFIIASYFLLGSLATGLAFGAELYLDPAVVLSAVVLTGLLVSSHVCIGIMSAGAIMKIKQGDPIVWAFSWMTQLVSGVFYPLGLLPWYLRWIGLAFPLTPALDGIRRCLQGGETLLSPAVLTDAVSLIVFTAVALPVALLVFKAGYNSSRRDGSLSQY